MKKEQHLYYLMKKIRMVENAIAAHYSEREMHTAIHLYNGQEAVAVGVCACLRLTDSVYSNHRSHGHYLAKGGDLNRLIAELYNKETGCCRGRGGSMHIFDASVSFALSSSIVAGNVSIATGGAYAEKMKGTDNIVVSFLGDAATEEGTVYESICFAQLHKLPIIYVCENNLYSICTPLCKREPVQNIADKFGGIISTHIVDGNDVIKIKEKTQDAIKRARKGGGPSFIECKTYRLKDHHNVTDGVEKGYRTLDEISEWSEKDPILRYERTLMKQGLMDEKDKERIDEKIGREIETAFAFAKNSQLPKIEELGAGVWSD